MITTTEHPVFALLPEMSREDVIAHLPPIATELPSWDAKRNRLIASIPDLGPFPRIEMTFAPGLRAVFFRVGWQCTFDRLLERVDELEAWFGDPALTGLREKVAGARSRIERKGNAKMSMSVMFVMTDLPGGGHVSFSSGGFDAGGNEGYLIEVTWRPPARIDRGGLDELYESLKDDGSYLVLADALLERGDVRGELIHVQHALRQKADETLREREKQLLSRLELLDPSLHALKLEWHLGFVKSATIPKAVTAEDRTRIIDELFTSESSRLLEAIEVEPPEKTREVGIGEALEHLIKKKIAPPPKLTRINIGRQYSRNSGYWVYRDYGDYDHREDLTQLWQYLPNLAELRVDLGASSVSFGEINAPNLRSFEHVSPYQADYELSHLLEAEWPKLERFVLWTGGQLTVNEEDDLHYASDEDPDYLEPHVEAIRSHEALAGVFDNLDRFEHLTTFGIGNYAGAWAELLTGLRTHAFWRKLRTLDVSEGVFNGEDLDALREAKRDAPNLARMVVEKTLMAPETAKGLQQAGFELIGTPVASRSEEYRFVATME